MKYYQYRLIDQLIAFMISEDKEKIIKTIDYYQKERGFNFDQKHLDEKNLSVIDSLSIECGFPLQHIEHFIQASVVEGVTFSVNANAFDYIQEIASDYKKYKRGELYKFYPGLGPYHYYFSEQIMQGLHDYDWLQHQDQVLLWLNHRRDILNEAAEKGYLQRKKKIDLSSLIRKKSDSSKKN